MDSLGSTPSQTVGPFFGFALPYDGGARLVEAGRPGRDPDRGRRATTAPARRSPTRWSRSGRPTGPGATRIRTTTATSCRSRTASSASAAAAPTPDGRFWFATVKPGAVPGPDGAPQAPHIAVNVLARGLLRHLPTRIYFPDEAEANAADPVLSSIEDAAARETLIAREDGGVLRFDIHLQGDGETVFFDV